MKVNFDKDYLIEELDLPCSAILDEITSTSRWSENHKIIFEAEGKFYMTWYSCGKTEYQDESPWENDGQLIECTEVHQVEKIVKVWEPIN